MSTTVIRALAAIPLACVLGALALMADPAAASQPLVEAMWPAADAVVAGFDQNCPPTDPPTVPVIGGLDCESEKAIYTLWGPNGPIALASVDLLLECPGSVHATVLSGACETYTPAKYAQAFASGISDYSHVTVECGCKAGIE